MEIVPQQYPFSSQRLEIGTQRLLTVAERMEIVAQRLPASSKRVETTTQ